MTTKRPNLSPPTSRELSRKYFQELLKKDPRFVKSPNTSPQKMRRGVNFTNVVNPKLSDEDKKVIDKIKIAIDHYLQGDPSLAMKPNFLFSHLNGIDFKLPVRLKELHEGMELNQMQAAGKGVGETRQGQYYAELKVDVESDAHLRGIADSSLLKQSLGSDTEYFAAQKEHTDYYTTDTITALESSANPITDDWSLKNWEENVAAPIKAEGGGIQLHINADDNKKVQPMIYKEWMQCFDDIKNNKSMSPAETEKAKDIFNTYAMILYNRASFNKSNLEPLLDRIIMLQDELGNHQHPLAKEALEITIMAAKASIGALEKIDLKKEKNADILGNKLDKALTQRRADNKKQMSLKGGG